MRLQAVRNIALLRCLGLFHKFDNVDTGGPWSGSYGHLWYCTRCLGSYERDEEFVLSGLWGRLLWRVGGYRLYSWWHSWAWRFER